MEKYIVQWKVAQRVMESFTWCNGKFRSGQWKVYNYIRALESLQLHFFLRLVKSISLAGKCVILE